MSLIKFLIRASGLTGAGGTLPFEPTPEQYAQLQKWPMVRDPYAAEKDYHPIQRWLRWLKPAQIQAYRKYNTVRNNQIKAGEIDFQKYFETVPRPISREKWEYLKLRKSWYIIVNWPRFAGEDCRRILDCACGDGDVTQRLVDYVADEWKKTGKGHELEVVGMMRELYATDAPDLGVDPQKFPMTIDRLLAEPSRGRIVLLMQDDALAGYALLIPYWSNEFAGMVVLIDELLVGEQFRGQGIARAFLRFLIAADVIAHPVRELAHGDLGINGHRRC